MFDRIEHRIDMTENRTLNRMESYLEAVKTLSHVMSEYARVLEADFALAESTNFEDGASKFIWRIDTITNHAANTTKEFARTEAQLKECAGALVELYRVRDAFADDETETR